MNESATAPIRLRPDVVAAHPPVRHVRRRSLPPRAGLHGFCPPENVMKLPKVVELKRGSAHGAPVVPSTAAGSNPHQIGGHRWNSGS
jgi:hypothetical protein